MFKFTIYKSFEVTCCNLALDKWIKNAILWTLGRSYPCLLRLQPKTQNKTEMSYNQWNNGLITVSKWYSHSTKHCSLALSVVKNSNLEFLLNPVLWAQFLIMGAYSTSCNNSWITVCLSRLHVGLMWQNKYLTKQKAKCVLYKETAIH